jgi:molybdenum ABC transporter molybdate-binding protein
VKHLPAALAVVLTVATGCGGSSGPTTLTVLAASSLTDAFHELGPAYQSSHQNVKLRFSFADSQELAEQVKEQVKENAPADVLATADAPTMDGLAEYVDRPSRRVIAYNSLTIAVAPGNPRRIHELADLDRPGLRVVLAALNVPAGRYSRQVLTKAGVTVRPASEEVDVRSVLTRVRTGEADAGIVYLTDLRSAGRAASSVPIPAAQNVTASYPTAVIDDSGHKDASAAFVTWLGSAAARSVLNANGFTTP